ncbi:hypothetical protein DL764_010038 [Monosporascus ibericus]|uniref:lytic cellulose monooxygenase (C4-dehydrogenating) n=1 Tax=Monosporascus ibericus TaxID=155417 RepID=A0A4Q4SWA1_9PEZI|nr:hypothetical protein DL764_010038 [Monosporascus ibericus]
MPSFTAALLGLAATATVVLGHGHVREVIVNGRSYHGFERWASNQDLSQVVTWQFTTEDEGPVPIGSLENPDIICHQGAQNALASVPVNAGDEITLKWFNSIGGFEHPGPIMHYLASCGDAGCGSVDKNSLRFFKFYESGLIQGGMADSPVWNSQKWATTEVHKGVQTVSDGLIDTFTVRVPRNIPSGNYVLRHEMLGLHRAHLGDAEFYPQCINLQVTGSGSGPLPEGVPATQLYKGTDPGVDLDIWVNLQSYQIPGPAVVTSVLKRDEGMSRSRDFAPRH